MVKRTQHLTREDWILAGFRALTIGGAGALRVEPVARALSATKGSFYWHFADPSDWRTGMLVYWEYVAFHKIVADLQPTPPGLSRLQALVRMATTLGHDPLHGGVAAEPALRDWARYAPDVAMAVRRVDAGRVAFVADCLQAAIGSDQDISLKARQFYAAYLGFQAMHGTPEDNATALLDLTVCLCRPK